jgi:hypothetical protein
MRMRNVPRSLDNRGSVNTELADRLQNELVKLARLTCRSYTTMIYEDFADVCGYIIGHTMVLRRASSIWNVSIKEECDDARTP